MADLGNVPKGGYEKTFFITMCNGYLDKKRADYKTATLFKIIVNNKGDFKPNKDREGWGLMRGISQKMVARLWLMEHYTGVVVGIPLKTDWEDALKSVENPYFEGKDEGSEGWDQFTLETWNETHKWLKENTNGQYVTADDMYHDFTDFIKDDMLLNPAPVEAKRQELLRKNTEGEGNGGAAQASASGT